MDTFVIDGVVFRWAYEQDGGMRYPWVEHDGHGVIRTSSARHSQDAEKKPSEKIIFSGYGVHYLYDIAATTSLAKKDGWGLALEEIAKLGQRLGKAPTPKQITAAAVQSDIDFCTKYLNGDVQWFDVSCWVDGEKDDKEYLGGILCEAGDDYLEEAARDLAGELLGQRKDREVELDLAMAGL